MNSPRRPLLASMPVFPIALGLMAGIVVGSVWPNYLIYGAALMAALCILGILFKCSRLVLAGASVAVGMLTVEVHTPLELNVTGEAGVYTGVTVRVKRYDFSQRITLRLVCDPEVSGGMIWLRLNAGVPAIEMGDTLRFASVLEPLGKVRHYPGEFVPGIYASREGVTAMATLMTDDSASCPHGLEVTKPKSAGMSGWMSRQRERFMDAIYGSGIDSSSAAFLTAVLTGESSYLDDELRAVFATAGTAHILALSGMHVAVIAFMASLLMFPLRLMGKRRMAMASTIAILWFYALLTGLSPSVFRAVVMATVVFGGMIMRRDSSPMNSLCLAAVVILLFRPNELFSAGFQLSFVAVAAIVMFAFELRPGWKMALPVRVAWEWVAVCVSAVAGTAAISAWHFHLIPVYFILANIPAALILPVLMIGEMSLILANAIGLSPEWLVMFIDTGYSWLAGITGFIASLSGASLKSVVFPWWMIATYYGGLLALWLALRWRSRFWGISGGILLAFTVVAYFQTPPPYPRSEAYVVEYPYATVIVAREEGRCVLLSDAPPSQYDKINDLMSSRLKDFTEIRGVPLEPVNTVLRGKDIYAVGKVWCFRDKVVVPVGLRRDLSPVPVHPCYALISGRYYGSMAEVKETLDPDTIVLAPSLSQQQMQRYKAELDTLGLPFRVGLPVRLL